MNPKYNVKKAAPPTSKKMIVGIIMMIVVGIIIIGGIKRIASVTEKIVPFMAGMYVIACLYIIFSNLSFVDDAFAMIVNQAFAPSAAVGGFIGVLVQGRVRKKKYIQQMQLKLDQHLQVLVLSP